MNSDPFSALTQAEKDELALCGITSSQQMLATAPAKIYQELCKAREYFPNKKYTLTLERLQELCGQGNITKQNIQTETLADITITNPRSGIPTTGLRRHARRPDPISADKKRSVIMHSPVRCTHRFTTFMAAFFTLFLFVPIASIVVFPILLATDNMPALPLEVLATIVFVIPCLVYMFISRRATCPVCHMRIFRFSHYNRNRAAHYLPLLGYNFTTALHLLFFWRYNCPGCGTPVKLLGAKGHRTHC